MNLLYSLLVSFLLPDIGMETLEYRDEWSTWLQIA